MKQILTRAFIGLFMAFSLPVAVFAQTSVPVSTMAPYGCTSPVNSDLRIGAYDAYTNGSVSGLQNFLITQGYFNSAYLGSGRFGPITFSSVTNFQAAHGLPATGFVGPLTRAVILQITCNTLPPNPPVTLNPTIYSINPTSGPTGTEVTITGYGFGESNAILMDGMTAAANVRVSSQIAVSCTTDPTCRGGIRQTLVFTIPSYISPYCTTGFACPLYASQIITSKQYAITVATSNATSNAMNFYVTGGTTPPPPPPPPTPVSGVSISSITPTSGPTGTQVTITGYGFTNSNTIVMDGMTAATGVGISSSYTEYCSTMALGCPARVRQTLVFTIPTYLTPYCAPGMYCTLSYYTRSVTAGLHSVSVSNTNGSSNAQDFSVTDTSTGGPLSITGVDVPPTLTIGQSGAWTVHVTSGHSGGMLHYSAVWGDEGGSVTGSIIAPQPSSTSNTTTFTHTYRVSGTYTPRFTVTDDYGGSATANTTVLVNPIY